MGLVDLREEVRWLRENYQASQQRACGLMAIAVSNFHYQSTRSDQALRKRLVREGSPRPAFTAANQEWAADFAHDAMASGRAIRVLSVVDECTRECLTLEVDTSFASRRVTRALEMILTARETHCRFAATTGRTSPAGIFWPGAWNGASSWCTFSRGSRSRTDTWKVSTASCAMNA